MRPARLVAFVAAVAIPLLWAQSVMAGGRAVTTSSDWPMFRGNMAHLGVSAETALGASNAGSLKVHWKASLGSKSYSSPAVVENTTLDKTLVYIGNQGGTLSAWDAANGAAVWKFKVPSPGIKQIQTSPAVYKGTLYFGASDRTLYALNATTGALICKYKTTGIISSSPVVVDPDGNGPVVYFGDSGPSGLAADGGHLWALNAVGNSAGPCTLKWSFSAYGNPPGSFTGRAGTYNSPAFGVDQNSRPVIVFGSTDDDDGIYSVDARTGALVWRFQTKITHDSDVGAPPTISAPGVNGIASGMVYIMGKDGIVYGLNLTTGAQKWMFNMNKVVGRLAEPAQSGVTLQGNTGYFGYGGGLFALNATTGAVVWQNATGTGYISSPSMSGGSGDRVLFGGDLTGKITGMSAASGATLFQMSTGGFIYSSPAVSGGQVFIASTDAFLYAIGT